MAKLFGRIVVLCLVCAAGYLWIEVSDLRAQNADLRAEIGRLAQLRSENASLRARLAARMEATKPARETGPSVWLSAARQHVDKAEALVAKGDFTGALRQTRFANLALSRAAADASGPTASAVAALRRRLEPIEAEAQAMWRNLGV